jgi:hypothetical protein
LKVSAAQRPCAKEALQHPFMQRRLKANVEASVFFHGPVSNWMERDANWAQLDGFQKLGWLAIARAVAEPELDRQAISAALDGAKAAATSNHKQLGADPREATYLHQLARELGTSHHLHQWLQDRSAWAEVLRLAFSYLDVDSDGVLSAHDIGMHVLMGGGRTAATSENPAGGVSMEALSIGRRWISRWKAGNELQRDSRCQENDPNSEGLNMACFRAALLASQANDSIFEAFDAPLASAMANDLYGHETENPNVHPSFSRVTAGPHEQEEEEINWTDLMSRGTNNAAMDNA